MDTKALEYIRTVNPQDPELKKHLVQEGDLYIGPSHPIADTTNFPSPSSVVNESMFQTGMYVPPEHCDAFDDEWKSCMTKCCDNANQRSQLDDYLKTGISAGRKLQLQVMVLPPQTFFKIHAHPNIEFELTIKGTLEEFRFPFCVPIDELTVSSDDTNKCDIKNETSSSSSSSSMPSSLVGPTIRSTDVFVHNKVMAGQCMINEIGSTHQSFTGVEEPCAILVLWSGCHANTHPSNVHCADCRLRPTAGW